MKKSRERRGGAEKPTATTQPPEQAPKASPVGGAAPAKPGRKKDALLRAKGWESAPPRVPKSSLPKDQATPGKKTAARAGEGKLPEPIAVSLLPVLREQIDATLAALAPDLPTPSNPAPEEWIKDVALSFHTSMELLLVNVKLGSDSATRYFFLTLCRLHGKLDALYREPTEAIRNYVSGLTGLPLFDSLDPWLRAENKALMENLKLGSALSLNPKNRPRKLPGKFAEKLWILVSETRSNLGWVTDLPDTRLRGISIPGWVIAAVKLPSLALGIASSETVMKWFEVAWQMVLAAAKGEPENYAELRELGKLGWIKYKNIHGYHSLKTDRANLYSKAKDSVERAFFALFGLSLPQKLGKTLGKPE